MQVPDFLHSYLRCYTDFESRQPISLSHKPPTKTNRIRIILESICTLTHRPSGRSTTYALGASCKTEQVGATRNNLWLSPIADCAFLGSDDGQAAIYKSWHKNNPGVMLHPPSLGPQPEQQYFLADDNFDEFSLNLIFADATPLTEFEAVQQAIESTSPIVSRIEYVEGEFDVRIDQPVKAINIGERDGLHQTDTGPILLPDLSKTRLSQSKMEIDVFDLAYSAWHASDWAEFVIRAPVMLGEGISTNHYSTTRHIEPTSNTLFSLDNV